MSEYISREAVLSKCADIWDNADETTQTGVDTINTIDEITDFIESLPTADVYPAKHGRWENEHIEDDEAWWADCTNCKLETHSRFGRVSFYVFCPNCGARMDLKDGDTNG